MPEGQWIHVRVHVDEPGNDQTLIGREHLLSSLHRDVMFNGGDPPVRDRHLFATTELLGWDRRLRRR